MVSGEDITPAITVLVADDNTATRELIAEICRHCGASVVERTNGIEAVDAFKKHQPDCSLLDFQMPEMDGLKAIAHIKALSPPARVFMVTQYDSENLRQAAAEAGADGFVPKDCLHMLPDLLKAERVFRMFALHGASK
ncbi:MAG: response regulator transcription factor [Verrucomicrobiota bacterium]|nr:response regulator transcription factor [Verrucomicrobiota bacterium]